MTMISERRKLFSSILVAGLIAWCGATGVAIADDDDDDGGGGLRVIGLTDDGHLVRFKSSSPRNIKDLGLVELNGGDGDDTELVGIDYRVQDGKLYGVGNGGGVFVIDASTAVATFVNELSVALAGTRFGVDFNPAADRLRIISDTGQNLAHNVNTGGTTAANGTVTYTAPPAAPVAATGVTGAAYTNNDLNQASTATTLYDIDTTLNQVAIQSPAASGVLVATGALGVDAAAWAGFDIYSRLRSGVTVSNHAFAALIVGVSPGFYSIELTTGRATRLGTLGEMVVDIAIPLDQKGK